MEFQKVMKAVDLWKKIYHVMQNKAKQSNGNITVTTNSKIYKTSGCSVSKQQILPLDCWFSELLSSG